MSKPKACPSLQDHFFEEPYRFAFFQSIRLLERMYPRRKPLGLHVSPDEEVARLRSHISMSFPASEIYDAGKPSRDADGDPMAVVWVTFMGLAGTGGPLPLHLTRLLSEDDRRSLKETQPLRDWLDLFGHRMISLFYRAWEKYRFPIAYERDGRDRFSRYLFSLIGMSTEGLRGRLGFEDQILVYYAGLLSQRPRSVSALRAILRDYFQVPVEVEQFEGQWFKMNPDDLTRLGTPGQPIGQNCRLGAVPDPVRRRDHPRDDLSSRNVVLWQRFFDPHASFRVRVGPLTASEFQDFLPPGSAHRKLVEMTRFIVGDEFDFSFQLSVRHDEVPDFWLGAFDSDEARRPDRGTRLGWSTWLKDPLAGPREDRPRRRQTLLRPFERDTRQPLFRIRSTRAEAEFS